jgi:hypothetical protein
MTSTQTTLERPYTQANRPYTAYGAAAAMWSCRALETVLEGPAGTGKSRGLLEYGHFCAGKYAGCRILLTRLTRESMTESVLVTFEDQVLPEGHYLLSGPKRANRQSYDYTNGSTIVVAGLLANGKDQRAKVMSTEYDIILIFEAPEVPLNDYENLITRLRNGVMPYQRLIADCNPDVPTHWLHKRCDAGIAQVFFSRHEDNPKLYDRKRQTWTPFGLAYIAALDKTTGARHKRLRLGLRASVEGAIYEFDIAAHVISHMPAGWQSWRKMRGFDFGFTNPFVCQWWAIDPDDRIYLYREIYMSQRTVQTHAPQVVRLSGNEWYEANVADHDAGDRATLESFGISTIAATKTVSAGIQAVQERLKLAGDGKPRLYILAGCRIEVDPSLEDKHKPTCTQEEFPGYAWSKQADGKPNKEEPIKVDDHGMDCMRYVVMYLEQYGDFSL